MASSNNLFSLLLPPSPKKVCATTIHHVAIRMYPSESATSVHSSDSSKFVFLKTTFSVLGYFDFNKNRGYICDACVKYASKGAGTCDVGNFLKLQCLGDIILATNMDALILGTMNQRFNAEIETEGANFVNCCTKHLAQLTTGYDQFQLKRGCANPYHSHSSAVTKTIRQISDSNHANWKSRFPFLISGRYLCMNCRMKVTSECNSIEEEAMEAELDSVLGTAEAENMDTEEQAVTGPEHAGIEMESSSKSSSQVSSQSVEDMDMPYCNLNEDLAYTLSQAGITISLTNLTEGSDNYFRKVYIGIRDKIKSCILNHDPYSTKKLCLANHEDCADCQRLITDLTTKFKAAESRQEKFLILTCLPQSMTIQQVMDATNCREYLARQASKAKRDTGAFTEMPTHKGRPFSEDVASAVMDFYISDNNSRPMPGQRDTIMIKRPDGSKERVAKQLMLTTLKDLFMEFKDIHPTVKIKYTKFSMLRPKQCVWAGARGFHSTCTCVIHQNFYMLMQSAGIDGKTSDFLSRLVCQIENADCMLGLCPNCPDEKSFGDLVKEIDDEDMIKYKQWTKTDGIELLDCVLIGSDFKEKVKNYVPLIAEHFFITRKQKSFLQDLRDSLKEEPRSCIIQADFGENYSFIVQNAAQGFHWNNSQCTVHPFFVTWFSTSLNKLESVGYVVISDHLTHDTNAFEYFKYELVKLLKRDKPNIQKCYYVSDGAASQYKNYKNFVNLMLHKARHGLDAVWHFSSTSHGKSQCDALAGVVKRSARLHSLRPGMHIRNAHEMFQFCKEKLETSSLQFIYAATESVQSFIVVQELEKYYAENATLTGTRKFHSFTPVKQDLLEARRYSSSVFCSKFKFPGFRIILEDSQTMLANGLRIGQFIAVFANRNYQLGVILEADNTEQDWNVSFMVKGARHENTYKWPNKPKHDWIPACDILCTVEPPNSQTGRLYHLSNADAEKIQEKFDTKMKK